MDDARFTALMVGAGFEDPMADLWEIAAHEGDLLTGSLWWETAEAEDRQGTWWTPTASDPGKHEDWDEWLDDWHKEDGK